MADNEIRITSEAIKELREQLAKLELQFRAGGNITQYNDAVLKLRDQFAVTHANAKNLSSQLVVLDNAMGKSANAARGGIVSAIQEMNTKLGNTRPLVTSMSQAMQDSAQFSMGAAQGIRAVANNIEMMVQQMTYLRSQGMSVGDIFASMRSTIMGPIGILLAFSALSAAIQWVVTGLQQSGKAAKDAKTEFKDLVFELNDVLYKLGLISGGSGSMIIGRQVAIAGIDTKLAQLRRPVPLLSEAREARTYRGPAGDLINIPAKSAVEDTATMIKNETEIDALLKERAKLMSDIDGFQKDIAKSLKGQVKEQRDSTKELEKQTKELERQYKELRNIWEKYIEITVSGPSLQPTGIASGRDSVWAMKRRVSQADKPKGWLGKEKIDYFGLKDAEKEGETFTKELTRGLAGATDTLARGFTNSFNLGQTLLGQFAASIMAVFAEIAAKKAMLGLLDILGLGVQVGGAIATGGASLIPTALYGGAKTITARASGGWINEPVVGMGMQSRSIYTLAERGPEYVSPASSNRMGQQGRGGGGMQPVVNVFNSFNEAGVSTVVERGDRMNKRRRY